MTSNNPFAKAIENSGVNKKATKDGTKKRVEKLTADIAAMRTAKHKGVLVVPKGFYEADKVVAFLATCKADNLGVTVHKADVLTVKALVEAALKADGKAQEFSHFTVGKNARAYLIG